MHIWFPTVRTSSGTDHYAQRLADGLEQSGHHASLTWFPHRFELFPQRMVHSVKPPQFDAFHTNSWHSFSLPDLPQVTTVHNWVHDPAYSPYRSRLQALYHNSVIWPHESKAVQHTRHVVAISEYTAARLRESFPSVHPTVILNGIDTEFFCPKQATTDPQGPFRLLFAGSHSRRKGFDLLPRIMTELGDQYVLYTADTSPTPPQQMNSNIYRLGRLTADQLRDQYQQCDALLFPTRYDGFGYVACEAMACGKPVVATNTAAIPEVVQHDATGFLCATDDVDAFVDSIRTLKQDSDLRQEFGKAGRQRVEQRFTVRRMIDEYIALYESL